MKEVINEYNVVPLPVTMNEQPGRFYLNSDVPVVVNASQEVKNIASSLSTTVLDVAGIKLKPGGELHENVPTIVFDSIPGMEKEAYKLSVTPQQIKITASTPNGFYYGLQTLYQLLPVAIYSKERARNAELERTLRRDRRYSGVPISRSNAGCMPSFCIDRLHQKIH